MSTHFTLLSSDKTPRCSHHHRTAHAAGKCLRRHRIGCRNQGGFSDAFVAKFDDDGRELSMTDNEHDDADQASCGYC